MHEIVEPHPEPAVADVPAVAPDAASAGVLAAVPASAAAAAPVNGGSAPARSAGIAAGAEALPSPDDRASAGAVLDERASVPAGETARATASAEPAAAAMPRTRGRAIVVTSGKGGVGKTTTTANLGAALASGGASVVLVDADVGLRNLDIVMGLEARVRHHVLDVLEGKTTLDDALVSDKRVPSLKLLAAAQTREKDDVDTAAFRDLIGSLRDRFDYVLIDCPAGIEKGFANAIVGADEAIVVCTPEVSAVRDADRVVGLLGDGRRVTLIVNRLRPALVKKGKMLSVDDVNGILRLPLIGVVADAPDVIVSTNKGEPVALDAASPVGEAYRQIAQRIAGTLQTPPEIPREKSFFEKLFGGRS